MVCLDHRWCSMALLDTSAPRPAPPRQYSALPPEGDEEGYDADGLAVSRDIDFIREQERIDENERKTFRANSRLDDPITKLTLGPTLEKRYGRLDEPQIRSFIRLAKAPVALHVYDVGHTDNVDRINDILGKLHLGGIYHGAIEIHNREWSFGGTSSDTPGIFCNEPARCSMHRYQETVYLGDCMKNNEEVEQILRDMLPDWGGLTYDLLHKNCCSFSNDFANKLGVGPIPSWVHSLAHAGAIVDDDTAIFLSGLHKVEAKVAQKAHNVLNKLTGQGRTVSKRERACRCCWYD